MTEVEPTHLFWGKKVVTRGKDEGRLVPMVIESLPRHSKVIIFTSTTHAYYLFLDIYTPPTANLWIFPFNWRVPMRHLWDKMVQSTPI